MKIAVFIDVQKDFIDGALRNEKAIETTPKIVEFAKDCVKKGYKIYATRDTHEKTRYSVDHDKILKTEYNIASNGEKIPVEHYNAVPVSGYFTTLEGKKLPVAHCIEMTEGWMIDDRLMATIDGKCTIINKPTFGSFDLGEIIDEDIQSGSVLDNLPEDKRFDELYNPIDEIILCGYCTDICVVSNALLLRAKFPNTKITVMKDLCAGVTLETHEAALKTMEMCQIDIA